MPVKLFEAGDVIKNVGIQGIYETSTRVRDTKYNIKYSCGCEGTISHKALTARRSKEGKCCKCGKGFNENNANHTEREERQRNPDKGPCDGCKHQKRCSVLYLACNDYARYALDSRKRGRAPSRAIYHRINQGAL